MKGRGDIWTTFIGWFILSAIIAANITPHITERLTIVVIATPLLTGATLLFLRSRGRQ